MKSEIVIVNDRVYHLGLAKGELASNVIIVGDPARATLVSERFDRIDHRIAKREFLTLTGVFQGLPVSVIGTGIGTDNVEIALVEAYIINEFDFDCRTRMPGAKPLTIIRVGTSGGVQAGVEPGTLAIASYALGLDSTGPYYEVAPSDQLSTEIEKMATAILDDSISENSRFKGRLVSYASKASESVTAALAAAATRSNAAFEVGITISSPGFYGPSSRLIEGLTNTVTDIKKQLSAIAVGGLRVINMEMESSLLFHLCSQLNYVAGTICPIISDPDSSAAVVNYDALIEQTITIALDAMVELNKPPRA